MKPDLRAHSDKCEHNDRWDSCERASPAELLEAARPHADLEAAAEAMYDADDANNLTWEDQGERNGVRGWYRDMARAAVLAALGADDE